MLIVITLLYPVINYPAVAGLDAICFPTRHASMTRRRLWSCGLLAGVVAINVALPNIGTAFGLCGALGLGTLAYALPGACFLKLVGLGRAPTKLEGGPLANHATTALLENGAGNGSGGGEAEAEEGEEGAEYGSPPPRLLPLRSRATGRTWVLAAGAAVVLIVGLVLTFGSTARIIYVAATAKMKAPTEERVCANP